MLQSFSTTGIGSMPHSDALEACRIIFECVDIPFWPQLPRKSFLESMILQCSEGFPFIKIEAGNIYVERPEEEAISSFYETIEREGGLPLSKEYANGLYVFIDILKQQGKRLCAVKGHITGPLTFTLGITDNQRRPIYFNEEMRELALHLLKGKALWQIERLKPFTEKVIIFIDEPLLGSLGTSTYIGVDRAEVSRLLMELVSYIRNSGSIAGIHCCGKADWSIVLSSRPDILSFDAYLFGDTLSIYPEEIKAFLNNGGFIAWGIVPTTSAIKKVTLRELRMHIEEGLLSLEKMGIPGDRLRKQLLLTPSCGTGSMEVNDAMRVLSLLKDLRNSYAKD